VTLKASRIFDGLGLYVKFAVSQLEVHQVSHYTSISACIHTCKSKCLRLAAGVPGT